PVLIKRLTIKKLHLTEHTVQITLKNEADLKEMIDQLKENFIEVKDIQIKELNNDEHFLSALIIVDDSVETLDIYQVVTKTITAIYIKASTKQAQTISSKSFIN